MDKAQKLQKLGDALIALAKKHGCDLAVATLSLSKDAIVNCRLHGGVGTVEVKVHDTK